MAEASPAGDILVITGKGSRQPRNFGFTQQTLSAHRPLLSPAWVVGIFLVLGVVFVPIGAACLSAALSVRELSAEYDKLCITGSSASERDAALSQTGGNGTTCEVDLRVASDMQAPVFVYVELDNFYQNHRRYVRSRDDAQLRGQPRIGANLDACEPERYLAGSPAAVINPCGLVAWSLFNDTYTMTIAGAVLPISTSGIAWETELQDKFSGIEQPANFNSLPEVRGGGMLPAAPLNTDQRFIAWMRTAALPNFRKLWGVIDQDLKAGTTLTVTIVNAYNTYRFGGKKVLVLSTASWVGGHNPFLGIAYLTVGGVSVLFSVAFFVVQSIFPRTLGDIKQLSFRHSTSQ